MTTYNLPADHAEEVVLPFHPEAPELSRDATDRTSATEQVGPYSDETPWHVP